MTTDTLDGLSTPCIITSTVAAFNREDKTDGLRVHEHAMPGVPSIWEKLGALAHDGRHEIFVVYDEGQNNTDQQLDLLLELSPAAVVLASATPEAALTEKLLALLGITAADLAKPEVVEDIVTFIPTEQVVAADLIKSTIAVQNDTRDLPDVVPAIVAELRALTVLAAQDGIDGSPKAIHVCDTNDEPNDDLLPWGLRQARPIRVWRELVAAGVDPLKIAIHAGLKRSPDMPAEFRLLSDYKELEPGGFEHIIFNKKLEEGWDEPTVYIVHMDQEIDSARRIKQIAGRGLRQPTVGGVLRRSAVPELNTVKFWVRAANETMRTVMRQLRAELSTDPFDPAYQYLRVIEVEAGTPESLPVIAGRGRTLPLFVLEAEGDDAGVGLREAYLSTISSIPMFDEGQRRRAAIQSTALYDLGSSEISYGAEASSGFEREFTALDLVLYRLRAIITEAAGAIDRDRDIVMRASPDLMARLGQRVAHGTPAAERCLEVAEAMALDYIGRVSYQEKRTRRYEVPSFRKRAGTPLLPFENSLHRGYDGLNGGEERCADALDGLGCRWARNPSTSEGYSLPLATYGSSPRHFRPDFLVFGEGETILLDPKGAHLLEDAVRQKLLDPITASDGPRLRVILAVEGRAVPRDDRPFEVVDTSGVSSFCRETDGALSIRWHIDWTAMLRVEVLRRD